VTLPRETGHPGTGDGKLQPPVLYVWLLVRLVRLVTMLGFQLVTVALVSCGGPGGVDAPATGNPLTEAESVYLASANRILADANQAFQAVYFPLIDRDQSVETASVSEARDRIRDLSGDLAGLKAPARFSEQHSMLGRALGEIDGALAQAAMSLASADAAALETARTQAEAAFQLLRQASLSYLEQAR
jgi:hypothetical protein